MYKKGGWLRPNYIYNTIGRSKRMTRDETINILSDINKKRPSFFKNKSKEEKEQMIQEWHACLANENFNVVSYVTNIFLNSSRFVPYPREIRDYIHMNKDELDKIFNPWYLHFPNKGIVFYSDSDIEWASWYDWNSIPRELENRMFYRCDPNDEERNKLLKIALDKQMQLKRSRT